LATAFWLWRNASSFAMAPQYATHRSFSDAKHLGGFGIRHPFLFHRSNDSDANLLWVRISRLHPDLRSNISDHVNCRLV
jgi:hypothetical protein